MEQVVEGQTIRGRGRWVDYSNLVKLPHTVFALPFAVVGVILASFQSPVRTVDLVWVLLAFTSARFAAMGFNRVADREIDSRNARTQGRELPSGRLTTRQAGFSVALASALFLLSAGMLNRLCLVLAPFALAWVFLYSYTKRFTRWAHLVLGFGLAIAPIGAFLGIAGRWSEPPSVLLVLAGAVLCWVAGFDILYSLQDVDFDRREGLHSVPAALGVRGGIWVSRALHVSSAGLFALLGLLVPAFGTLYFVGVAIVAAMLLWEQSLVRPDDISRIDAAFFNINGAVSILFLLFVFAERMLQ